MSNEEGPGVTIDFAGGDFATVPLSLVQRAIMPLVHLVGDEFRSVGTCFAISPDGLCLTARHVIEEIWPGPVSDGRQPTDDDGTIYALYVDPDTPVEGGDLFGGLLPVMKVHLVDQLDIAALSLNLPVRVDTDEPIRLAVLRLGLNVPVLNAQSVAFGYHSISWQRDNPSHASVTQSFSASRGLVEELHIPCRDSVVLPFPCFRTSARYDGGMSGGPVFTDDGLVRGVVCSSIQQITDEQGHVSYVSLIAPAMCLRMSAKATPSATEGTFFVAEFVKGGAVSADEAGVELKVDPTNCVITFGGMQIYNPRSQTPLP